MISTLTNSKNDFSILSTNIQFIRAKFDELKLFIEHLRDSNFEFSAICIQETWLSESDDITQLKLDGYTSIPQFKSCCTKQGLFIYLHEKFSYDYKLKLSKNKSCNVQFINVKKEVKLNRSIIIGNIYCPPNDINDYYTEYIHELSPI